MVKKVLLVANNNLNRGGVQNVIMAIACNLHTEYQFDVVCFSGKTAYYDEAFLKNGGEIYRIPHYEGKSRFRRRLDFYIRGLRIFRGMKKILKQKKYDVIHCHNGEESGICLAAASAAGVPVRITHAHTSFDNYHAYNFVRKKYTDFLYDLICKHATARVGCSQLACQTQFKGLSSAVIYNTIDFHAFARKQDPERHDAPVLVQVAGFCENKNQLFSVEVFRALKADYPNSELILVGGDSLAYMKEYKRRVEEKVTEYSLEEAVIFLPQDANIPQAMEQADYLLLPSQREGLPLVAIEAQALGLSCFVSDSVSQEVDCGGCTFLPLSQGAEHWAAVIGKRFAATGGARGQWDMEKFHTDKIMNQIRNLYDGAIQCEK